MRYLLDIDVISETRKDALATPSVIGWLAQTPPSSLRRRRLGVPDPLPTVDGLLAATALVHDMTLVTRNTKDVLRTGVTLLNPFESPSSRGALPQRATE